MMLITRILVQFNLTVINELLQRGVKIYNLIVVIEMDIKGFKGTSLAGDFNGGHFAT